MKEENDQRIVKVRVSTKLYAIEREALHILAYRSGRSMSGYLRFLLREALDKNSPPKQVGNGVRR